MRDLFINKCASDHFHTLRAPQMISLKRAISIYFKVYLGVTSANMSSAKGKKHLRVAYEAEASSSSDGTFMTS